MHELSAATAIVRTVVQACEGREVRRIKLIRLQIGDLTLLNPEQLRFCFEIASKSTLAEGAELDIQRRPAELECRNCGKVFRWEPVDDPAFHLVGPRLGCECGASDIRVVSGREMQVVSMTVEQESRED
jgi:hydrogenase nickel incorporation protein HypA/HybF